MAHTIEDLVMVIADKHSNEASQYEKNKEMLWELVDKLHENYYIEKLIEPNYRDI